MKKTVIFFGAAVALLTMSINAAEALANKGVASAMTAGGLSAGYARRDITPPLGIPISGYYVRRTAKKILDPLEVVCIAFSDGKKTALVYTTDLLQIPNDVADEARATISAATGVPREGIFINATHTHTGPDLHRQVRKDRHTDDADMKLIRLYDSFLITRLADVGREAIADKAAAKLSVGRTNVERISFGRRYLMKDGKIRTNPGVGNPDIVKPVGTADETAQIVRIDRVGRAPIAIINFQTHPDVIGGEGISGDWPSMVRRTFEAALAPEGEVKCMFLNGTQGDVNHVCVDPKPGELNEMFHDFDDVWRGYAHAQHMGRVIASAALNVWGKCVPLTAGDIKFGERVVRVPSQRPKPEEMPLARKYNDLHQAGRDAEIPFKGMELTTTVADAARKIRLEHGPDYFDLPIIAITIGDALAFAGFPGEPFNEIGIVVRKNSPAKVTLCACLVNGSRGYFPNAEAYQQGGYESRTSDFGPSVMPDLINGQTALLKELLSAK